MKTPRTLLISGCPRSGTSWLHFMVSSHPMTVTCRETHVYDKYVGPLKQWFDKEYEYQSNDGLSSLFTEDEFVSSILAPIVTTTFDRIINNSNEGCLVVEKTPSSILHHKLIHRIQSHSKLLFIIRDPRAVYASFKAGSEEVWGHWMKKSVDEFCLSWNKYALSFLASEKYWPEEKLLCLKYEDLKMKPVEQLKHIYEWLELNASKKQIENIVEQNSIEKLRTVSKESIQYESRNQFYRKGKAFGWVDELSIDEIRSIERQCEYVMAVFGYTLFRKIKNNE